jgi:uncharacterized protein with HEPN domain
MTDRDPADLLRDILEAAEDAVSFVPALDAAAFERLPHEDRKTYRALKNAIFEIGETAKETPL